MELETIKIDVLKDCNMVLGQAHFIKTMEDLYEALVSSVPGIKFGLAFCESSGPCLVRTEGTDAELAKAAGENALRLACGHSFIIFLRGAYPINVLNAVKAVPEVCNIYCASANLVEVVIAKSAQGRGILGVIDGAKSAGIEGEKERRERKEFLRKIGYKL